jgi:hypothetical protein
MPVLKDLAMVSLVNSLIYSLQCSVKYLDKKDRNIALKRILEYKREVRLTSAHYNMIEGKEKLWTRLFMVMPKTTARIRNVLGVGY